MSLSPLKHCKSAHFVLHFHAGYKEYPEHSQVTSKELKLFRGLWRKRWIMDLDLVLLGGHWPPSPAQYLQMSCLCSSFDGQDRTVPFTTTFLKSYANETFGSGREGKAFNYRNLFNVDRHANSYQQATASQLFDWMFLEPLWEYLLYQKITSFLIGPCKTQDKPMFDYDFWLGWPHLDYPNVGQQDDFVGQWVNTFFGKHFHNFRKHSLKREFHYSRSFNNAIFGMFPRCARNAS